MLEWFDTWEKILAAAGAVIIALSAGIWKVGTYFHTVLREDRKKEEANSGAADREVAAVHAVTRIETSASPSQVVNVGLDVEGVRRVVAEEFGKSHRAEAAIFQGVDQHVIIAIAAKLGGGSISRDQAVVALDRAADELLDLRAERAAGSNLGDQVDEAVWRIRERIDANDPEGASAEGAQAVEQWRRRRAEAERRESERREEEMATGTRLAQETERAAFLAGDAAGVALWIERGLAIGVDAIDAPLTEIEAAFAQWSARGQDKGLNLDLKVAVELARTALQRPGLGPDERGDWGNKLGCALQTLGQREPGTARLAEAVDALRESQKVWTRERVPLDWARVQNNLGVALQIIGERETGTGWLEQAAEAYRAALEERTRARVPLEWASTKNNLGTALMLLGERERGVAQLQEAVAAFRAVLEEWTRERVPLEWARAQANLGTALSRLGEREVGTERLEEAVGAYRAALKEWTRERVPLGWAGTQDNLGVALALLGERGGGTARLEEAVDAFRAALEERMRNRVPLDWATTTMNKCTAEAQIAERLRRLDRIDRLELEIGEVREVLVAGGHTQGARRGERVLAEIAKIKASLSA